MGRDYEKDFTDRPVRSSLGWGIAAIFVIGVLVLAGSFFFGAITLVSQPGRIVQKTFDADNVIYNYEWFRQQYADIGGMATKLKNAEDARTSFELSAGPRADWKLSDRQQWDQLNRIVLGLQNQRVTMVAEYNGQASKANRSIFLAGLPDHIE